MRILDRHIFAELIGPFLFGVAAFTSLMFAGKEFFNLTELLAEYHAPVSVIAKLVLLHMPSLIVMTMPMAMLLATLLGFGRLSSDSETVALFAGGISMYRVMIPVFCMAVVVTAVSFVLSENVMPRTNSTHERMVRELRDEPLTSDKPFMVVDGDATVTRSVLFVQNGFDATNGTLRNVMMVQYENNKPIVLVCGKRAVRHGENEWRFEDGYWQTLGSDPNKPTISMRFSGTKTKKVDLNKTPEQLALYQKKYSEMSFVELRRYIRMLQEQGADVNEFKVRLYQKISIPLASLIFALIGAPLGLRPHRSSSAVGLGLAIVIIFAYWVFMHYMTILGQNGTVSPVAASFIPALAGLGAGVALVARASK